MVKPKRGSVLKSREYTLKFDLITVQNYSLDSKGRAVPGKIEFTLPVNIRI